LSDSAPMLSAITVIDGSESGRAYTRPKLLEVDRECLTSALVPQLRRVK
jgi:hypothetical protein